MSRYRSRSKERLIDENIERLQYEESKRERERDDFDKKIERIREEERNKEREWEKERDSYRRNETYLLKQIDRLRYQNQNYNQDRFNKYQRPFNQNRGYQRFNPRQNQFSNFNKNQPYNRYQNKSFINNRTNIQPGSELNKLISDLEKDNNNQNNNFDSTKFRRRIYLPDNQNFNVVGLLLGPKGIFQKLLEKRTDCKLYINGRTVKKNDAHRNQYDNDRNHVLIIGNSDEKVKNAARLVEQIIYADEKTRNKIMQEQSKALTQEDEKKDNYNNNYKTEDFLTSPYGPPSNNARYYKIPNDLVGLIIGTNGETVRKIATESHCKIQVGKAPIPNSSMRYIFIEGTDENYRIATGMIDRVIASKK